MLSAALLSAAALRLMAVGTDEPSAAAAGVGAAAGVPSWARGAASDEMVPAERERLRLVAKEMFYHGYDSYMRFAFPHDELQPLTLGWADSLGELGDAPKDPNSAYAGVALTLIDALDTLGVMRNASEFTRGVDWVCRNVSFDQDVRVNLFELNIRILGGLLSAHYLASDPSLGLVLRPQLYDGCLLQVALDVGARMLPAFQTATGLPRPWINLAKGEIRGDTRTQCTAGAGTLLLEFGYLSILSGNATFHRVALRALEALWARRSSVGLLGNTLDYSTGRWTNENAGIGAGVDSFYEYLLKSQVVFGASSSVAAMWEEAYAAARKHLKYGHWYVQSHMRTGRMVHHQFESLQAFWPALQVLAGDVGEAVQTHDAFFGLWNQFGFLPESYLLASRTVHPSMKYYPLRPELAESTYALYRATRDPYYLRQGETMLQSLNGAPRVPGGFASVKDVKNPRLLEDRMASFFLAETCKYLYLLFDEDNFVHDATRNVVFNTEGHFIPVQHARNTPTADPASGGAAAEAGADAPSLWQKAAKAVAGAADAIKSAVKADGLTSHHTCPNLGILDQTGASEFIGRRESWLSDLQRATPSQPPAQDPVCTPSAPTAHKRQAQNSNVLQVGGVEVQAGDGVFKLKSEEGENLIFRVMPNVGVEISHTSGEDAFFYLFGPKPEGAGPGVEMSATGFFVNLETADGASFTWPASNALFGPKIGPKTEASAMRLSQASPTDGCPSNQPPPPPPPPQEPTMPKTMRLVERGSCAFVSKVQAAQESGASAVIVVNNRKAELFMMGGDGTARQRTIRIPSVMVSAETGDAIRRIMREEAAKGKTVLATFGEHKFALGEDDAAAAGPNRGLRSPGAAGSTTDFEYMSNSDWGIRVNRLSDGNYQLMLIGERFAGGDVAPSPPSPTPPESPAAPTKAAPAKSKGRGQPAAPECWVEDLRHDHKCKSDSDCGVDSVTCKSRACSRYGYCTT